jgi:prepilin-type N-terminal cleavage/methylation domain-containing protein
MRKKIFKNTVNNQGFTLIELLFGMTIFSFLLIGTVSLQQLLFQSENFGVNSAFTIENAQSSLQEIVRELRNSRQGADGWYPIKLADSQEIIFHSNADKDDDIERIRYFLDGTDLKKGVTQPTGAPPTYLSEESVATVAQFVQNGTDPIFYYYNEDWPADQVNNPLSTPAVLLDVKLVKIEVSINADPDNPQSEYTLEPFVQIRMLKDNL